MANFNELKESWKNKAVFEKQLSLNLEQLGTDLGLARRFIKKHGRDILMAANSAYPPHWLELMSVLEHFQPKTILEIGCGVGAASQVVERHINGVEYNGSDYSEEAIDIAKRQWGTPEKFFVQDLWQLTEEIVQKYECILAGAVFDVMPDGDEALRFLLNLKPHNLYLQRMQFTNDPSYYVEYEAYGEIKTVQYYHNYNDFIEVVESHNYEMFPVLSNGILSLADSEGNHPTGFYLKGKKS